METGSSRSPLWEQTPPPQAPPTADMPLTPPSYPPPAFLQNETPSSPPTVPPPGDLAQPPSHLPRDFAAQPRTKIGWGTVFLSAIVSLLLVAGSLTIYHQAVNPNYPPAPQVLLTSDGELDLRAIIDKAGPSIVAVGGMQGGGSGVVISDDGLVLTNAHVVRAATEMQVRLSNGKETTANLVGSFPEEDIAVLQLDDPKGTVPATLGNSDFLQVGEPVVAIGHALNLGSDPTVTLGILSAKGRNILVPTGDSLEELLQTDAAINPGNSGGPLLNAAGEVVGINTAMATAAQSIGFAIPIDPIKPLVEDIRNGGGTVRSDQAFFGVMMVSPNAGIVPWDNELEIEGIVVTEVVPNSAAGKAGVLPGDELVSVNGQDVKTPDEVGKIIRSLQPGEEIVVEVLRQNQPLELSGILTTREQAR